MNLIPKKPLTQAYNLIVALKSSVNASTPLLDENASSEILDVSSVVKGPESQYWWAALASRIELVEEKSTWTLVPRPKDGQVMTSKSLLRHKLNPDQTLHCHKA